MVYKLQISLIFNYKSDYVLAMPIFLREQAFGGTARIYELTNPECDGDLELFMWSLYEEVRDEILPLMETHRLRGRIVVKVEFGKIGENNVIERIENFYITSLASDFINNFDEWFLQHTNALMRNLEKFNERSSNWIFNRIICAELKLSVIDSLNGGCGHDGQK